MKEFVGKFMFHPVGHGLFYSGIIKNCDNDNQYSFVYDCGGKNLKTIEAAIKNAALPDTIDLLIISHFHADHINGVLKLIEKHKIRTVILPYLNEKSKILYIADFADEEKDVFFAFKNFIWKPKSFFKNSKVYFISNNIEGKDEPEDENPNKEPLEPGTEFDFDLNPQLNTKKRLPSNVIYYKSPIWYFNFFMPKTTDKNTLSKLKQIFNTNNITSKNAKDLQEKMKIEDWKALKGQISTLKLNNNISNLICAHGPTGNVFMQTICNNKFIPSELFDHCWEYDCLCHYYYRHWHEENIGFQFLTGDAEVDDQKSFLTKYKSDLRKSILFQVPHHGSDKNWHDWFSEYQPFCNLWPVTHNADHNYIKGTFPSATFSYIAPYSVTEVKSTGLGIQIHFLVEFRKQEKNQMVRNSTTENYSHEIPRK